MDSLKHRAGTLVVLAAVAAGLAGCGGSLGSSSALPANLSSASRHTTEIIGGSPGFRTSVYAGVNGLVAVAVGTQVTGRLVNDAGTPIAGAVVTATVNGTVKASAVTASDGTFTFPSLAAGTYQLTVNNAPVATFVVVAGVSSLQLGTITD